MNLVYSTPTRMVQTVYSAQNSPRMAFPFSQKPTPLIKNSLYYSPNPTNPIHASFKTQRNPSLSNNILSENPRFLTQASEPKDDFSKKEENYLKTIDFLKTKMDEILKENSNLNQIIRKFQNGGVELHRSTGELESQINFLIRENERLSCLSQNQHFYKEIEAFNEEKALCQAKIDELHEKLTLIFEDNDKLSTVLREREEDFEKLQRIYERETRLRVDIEKKYEGLLAGKEPNMDGVKSNDHLINENRRLKEFLQEQQMTSKDLEGKVEMLIQENEKLNGSFQQKVDQIREYSLVNKSLNEENQKLNEILTMKLREIEEIQGENERLYNEMENNRQKDEVIGDLEKKVEILLAENGKLHAIIEEKLRDFEGNSNLQQRFLVLADEKNKLQMMLNKKNEAELYWKRKFEEIEGKIKVLFFQTNTPGGVV